MSCNGCRVLRKGCSESCILRPCLQWIESSEAQGHATVFVAKFFGRAGLMSFISSVPENQRPALFQSLLFEACGRTVNPVNGAVGLLWSGNWAVCQAAVESVLRGGTLRPMTDVLKGIQAPESDDAYGMDVVYPSVGRARDPYSRTKSSKRKGSGDVAKFQPTDLDLCLMQGISDKVSHGEEMMRYASEKRRPGTPSMNSEESVTTNFESSAVGDHNHGKHKLLNLFV